MARQNILIVDDEKNILLSLERALKLEGYGVVTAEKGTEGIVAAEKHAVDLVMLDVMLPDINGLEVIRKIKEDQPDLPVIMMSGHGTIATAVEATKKGAYDFIEKPLSIEKLLLVIENVLKYNRLKQAHESLQQEVEDQFQIIGESKLVRQMRQRIAKVAPSLGRVLITGENGVGKELVARAIHRQSTRIKGPFVKLNCAAIPRELIESELFGHEKGAFTGAIKSRKGKFELAHEGTIFLDEIGDMSLEMQAKLLRVLQENEFERVGSGDTIKVDVRVIAASNRNLEEEIEKENFRQDLFYRINVLPFHVPPLRERKEDIPMLARHFLVRSCEDNCKPQMAILPEAIGLLKTYHWPGNIRELRNIIERLVILADDDTINESDIREVMPALEHSPSIKHRSDRSLKAIMEELEREVIISRLNENDWQMTQTAKDLELERSHLYKKLKALGIERK